MPCHISIRSVTFTEWPGYVEITVVTDIPSRLWARHTLSPPRIHKKPVLRRGTWLNDDVRFCFDVFTDIPEVGGSDVLSHTFQIWDWPICTVKYFYFWGAEGGITCVSTSAWWKYHRVGIGGAEIINEPWTWDYVPKPTYVNLVTEAWTS